MTMKKEDLAREVAAALTRDDGDSMSRALEAMKEMHSEGLGHMRLAMAEAMAVVRHEADQTRVFAQQSMREVMAMRIATENPYAAKLHATLARATGAGGAGASTPDASPTDAASSGPRGADSDEVAVPVHAAEMEVRMGAVVGEAPFAGVIPRR